VRRRLREEKGGTSILNVMLDIAGLIPGVGEYFDAVNAMLYARKGEWLLAALSLVSVIPAIGDAVGKGGKLALWATKTFPKAAATATKYGPKIIEAIKLLKVTLEENKELIDALLKRAEKNEEMKKHIPKIREAITALRGEGGTLPANIQSILQGSNESFKRAPATAKNGNLLTGTSGINRKHPVSQMGLSEGMLYHVSRGISLEDPVWRPGTQEFFDLFREAKVLYREGGYSPTESERDILESDIGEWGLYEGKRVPLDFPMWDDAEMNEGAEYDFLPEAKYKGREVTLGAKGAKRSGGRAHVYVRDPDSGKVKRISFGSGAPDAMGDSESHRKRRKSFGNRHRCSQNKNRLSASYWACRATKMFGRNIPGWW
jgi:hypothetical protein